MHLSRHNILSSFPRQNPSLRSRGWSIACNHDHQFVVFRVLDRRCQQLPALIPLDAVVIQVQAKEVLLLLLL